MKKLAVFVEGETEVVFIEKLLLSVAGIKKIRISKSRDRGGGRAPHVRTLTGVAGEKQKPEYVANIIDCAGDERMTSTLRENYVGLCRERYDAIIGLRDVRGEKDGVPLSLADVPQVRRWMNHRIPTKPILATMILAVMEIEAWFLAEISHFANIDPSLTPDRVSQLLAFDPRTENVETRLRPSNDLDLVYKSVGQWYLEHLTGAKRSAVINKTLNSLNFDTVYLELGRRVPALVPLIQAIDVFLTPAN